MFGAEPGLPAVIHIALLSTFPACLFVFLNSSQSAMKTSTISRLRRQKGKQKRVLNPLCGIPLCKRKGVEMGTEVASVG